MPTTGFSKKAHPLGHAVLSRVARGRAGGVQRGLFTAVPTNVKPVYHRGGRMLVCYRGFFFVRVILISHRPFNIYNIIT